MLDASLQYSVLFDCGNSGTKLHVFKYTNGVPSEVFFEDGYGKRIVPTSEHKLPMIYVNKVYATLLFDDLKDYVQEYLDSPEIARHTNIFVIGTEGMRALSQFEQETVYNRTLDYLKKAEYWKNFIYDDDNFVTLTGVQEGIYAWFAANYINNNNFVNPFAVAEIGSTSAKIVFLDDDKANKDYHKDVTFAEESYTVFAHSFSNLGSDSALTNLTLSIAGSAEYGRSENIPHPCFPKGYTDSDDVDIIGTGDYDKCVELIKARVLVPGDCKTDECMFNGVPYPSAGIGRLIGLSVFYYPVQFFNQYPDKLSVQWPTETRQQTIAQTANFGREFCKQEWSDLLDLYGHDEEKYLKNYCFQLAYTNSFLQGLHYIDISDDVMRISSLPNDPDEQISWAYGVILARAQGDFGFYKISNVTVAVVVGVILGLALIALIVILILKCRKHNKEDDDFDMGVEEHLKPAENHVDSQNKDEKREDIQPVLL